MDGECCFVMHPDDERLFVQTVLEEPDIQFVNGIYWASPLPPTTWLYSELRNAQCLIWSPSDLSELKADQRGRRWVCNSIYATIVFDRSQMHDSVLTEGRICFRTMVSPEFPQSGVDQIKKRFNRFRRVIKKTYSNSVVCWHNPTTPHQPASIGRSGNPSRPDNRLWVGPNALQWLREDTSRRIKQFMQMTKEAILCDTTG